MFVAFLQTLKQDPQRLGEVYIKRLYLYNLLLESPLKTYFPVSEVQWSRP